jgi:hypothetical protein
VPQQRISAAVFSAQFMQIPARSTPYWIKFVRTAKYKTKPHAVDITCPPASYWAQSSPSIEFYRVLRS